jgi:hypothetical protein
MGNTLHKVEQMAVDQEDEATGSSWRNLVVIQFKKVIQNKKYLKVIIMIASILALFVAIIITAHYVNNKKSNLSSLTNKHNEIILSKLNQVNDQLETLARNPSNSKEQYLTLQGIEKNVAEIHQSLVAVAKIADIQKISNQIDSVKDAVDSQMSDIKKAMSEQGGNKQYLDPNALPFHVVAIDVISGEPYVSVNYQDHVSPLGISDMLAGWRLITADYDLNVAEFVNEKNQSVKINLQG